jgi:hypothetical protein
LDFPWIGNEKRMAKRTNAKNAETNRGFVATHVRMALAFFPSPLLEASRLYAIQPVRYTPKGVRG